MDEETIEGNKLIALFMGMTFVDEVTFLHKGQEIDRGKLNYHKSWDKLMPVVEKISKEFDVSISSVGLWATYISRKDIHDGEIATMGGKSPLENTWDCVVQFIKWWYKQPSYLKIKKRNCF